MFYIVAKHGLNSTLGDSTQSNRLHTRTWASLFYATEGTTLSCRDGFFNTFDMLKLRCISIFAGSYGNATVTCTPPLQPTSRKHMAVSRQQGRQLLHHSATSMDAHVTNKEQLWTQTLHMWHHTSMRAHTNH